jgi:hypothetical protein
MFPYSLFVARGHISNVTDIIGFEKLPSRFARLTWMSAVVIAPSTSSTAKTMAASSWTFGLGFGFVDRQCPSTQIASIQSRDRFVGFTGIGHFHEPKATRPSRIPIGHKCDLFDRAMCLEDGAQLRFSCAVR